MGTSWSPLQLHRLYCGVERPINVETRVTKEEEAKEGEDEEEGEEEEDAGKEMEKEEDEVDRTVFRFVTLCNTLEPRIDGPKSVLVSTQRSC